MVTFFLPLWQHLGIFLWFSLWGSGSAPEGKIHRSMGTSPHPQLWPGACNSQTCPLWASSSLSYSTAQTTLPKFLCWSFCLSVKLSFSVSAWLSLQFLRLGWPCDRPLTALGVDFSVCSAFFLLRWRDDFQSLYLIDGLETGSLWFPPDKILITSANCLCQLRWHSHAPGSRTWRASFGGLLLSLPQDVWVVFSFSVTIMSGAVMNTLECALWKICSYFCWVYM